MIFTAGLAVIIAGWIIQVYSTAVKKELNLSPAFLALYAIGCITLVVGNFLGSDITTGILNAICVVIVVILLVVVTICNRTS
jgi:hypothetical protein